MKKINLLFLLLLLIFTTSCAVKRHHRISYFKKYPPKKYVEIGYASWYGKKFHGRPTASGEIYNMYDLTAAHKKLPLGTYVRVTNLANRKSVIVKINDRGPFVKGRIIDLSYAAAKKIGMAEKGVQKVKIEIVSVPKYAKKYKNFFKYKKIYSVQVGSFKFKNNAIIMLSSLKKITKTVFYRKVKINGSIYYRVYAGKFKYKNSAKKLLQKLLKYGFDGFVVEIDE